MTRADDYIQRILAGESATHIAKTEGISRQRVCQIIARKQSYEELREQKEAAIADAITKFAEDGLTIEEVAHKLKMSYNQVRYKANKYYIPFADKKDA
ncbi:MAG: hypothetical protein WBB28_09405 [Crinalium sp.]